MLLKIICILKGGISMKRMKGFTLIELLIVVAIIAILAAIAVPNFLEAQVRSKVSRVKADQRSLATGLESYYVDNNSYPFNANGANGCNAFAGTGTGAFEIYTFRIRVGTEPFFTMTTPLAYITGYFPDPFADTKGASFGYYHDNAGWILTSFGPDTDEGDGTTRGDPGGPGDLGLPLENETDYVYQSGIAQPSLTLVTEGQTSSDDCYTYDPTNGTVSPGDVYRVKQ
jgi:general secretion pathway protein G